MRVGVEDERPLIPPESDLPGSPGGKRLELYIELMKECWDANPDNRPTFDQIAMRLGVQQTIVDEAALLTIQEAPAEGNSVSITAPASLRSSLNCAGRDGGGGGGGSGSGSGSGSGGAGPVAAQDSPFFSAFAATPPAVVLAAAVDGRPAAPDDSPFFTAGTLEGDASAGPLSPNAGAGGAAGGGPGSPTADFDRPFISGSATDAAEAPPDAAMGDLQPGGGPGAPAAAADSPLFAGPATAADSPFFGAFGSAGGAGGLDSEDSTGLSSAAAYAIAPPGGARGGDAFGLAVPATPEESPFAGMFGAGASAPLLAEAQSSYGSASGALGNMMPVPAGCSAPNPLAQPFVMRQPSAPHAGPPPPWGVAPPPMSFPPPSMAASMAPSALLSEGTAGAPQEPSAALAGQWGEAGGGRGEGGGLLTDNSTLGGALDAIISLTQVIPAEELTLIQTIRQGAEGRVILGRWNHIEVAAKACSKDLESLLREVKTLTTLNMHPNMVRFCGVCLRPPLVVTEYLRNGSLCVLLQKARKQLESKKSSQRHVKWLSWTRRLEMLHQVAGGMT
ncbi:hypothetical protein MNEG_14888 [Monoraphidium neglectum]|uniref:Protein kinase domain-containing protein n=1 Tax=Monoraphidium neglectum TaxID=145388 RepID=A0A0D2MCX6_9CHLO|nr:hypothetical protein MNEG_14888 [Monoraphidium neglectum]KIY93075.1 hypothetical protein MNEG_14888 [Monoraphidium neglectum]|eukprot:XP_013892095.1 hypothetical protein MNEG_14888 [Monoraphidium neglectum]